MATGTSLYYATDKSIGITLIGCMDDPNADYSFDLFFVFRDDASGRIFYGRDSGCSCPAPFENDTWNGPDDNTFDEVTKQTYDSFINEMWNDFYKGHSSLQDEKREIENKVKELLNVKF